MFIDPFYQGIMDGVREDREEGSTDSKILEAALKLLGRFVRRIDDLDKAAQDGGLRETARCIDRLIELSPKAYDLR